VALYVCSGQAGRRAGGPQNSCNCTTRHSSRSGALDCRPLRRVGEVPSPRGAGGCGQ
jgi:hypothetical protein